MWPLTFVSLFGRCLVTSFFVNPGKVYRNPLSIVFMRVDLTEKLSDTWCSLAISYFVVSDRTTTLHTLDLGRDGQLLDRLTIHILLPWMWL